MYSLLIALFVMLNPFALFLYLDPVQKELEKKKFLIVLIKASLISYAIFAFFLFSGSFIFDQILQINFDSFRIFGGIIMFTFAYFFVVNGYQAFIQVKEDLDEVASEIALPFMIGAGTISITVLIGNQFSFLNGLIGILLVLLATCISIITLYFIRSFFSKKHKVAFEKNMNILFRLNAFFVGAIGIDLIITGIKNIFF